MATLNELIPAKLFAFDDACEARTRLAEAGKRVVLTNGCFDLLHAGHIFSLTRARELGDSLWVALNSDASVRALKGDARPIVSQNVRAYMLSALSVVDGLFVFDSQHLDKEILRFRPDVYSKAGDYSIENLDRSELAALEVVGAEIEFTPFLRGFSTTSIIGKIAGQRS